MDQARLKRGEINRKGSFQDFLILQYDQNQMPSIFTANYLQRDDSDLNPLYSQRFKEKGKSQLLKENDLSILYKDTLNDDDMYQPRKKKKNIDIEKLKSKVFSENSVESQNYFKDQKKQNSILLTKQEPESFLQIKQNHHRNTSQILSTQNYHLDKSLWVHNQNSIQQNKSGHNSISSILLKSQSVSNLNKISNDKESTLIHILPLQSPSSMNLDRPQFTSLNFNKVGNFNEKEKQTKNELILKLPALRRLEYNPGSKITHLPLLSSRNNECLSPRLVEVQQQFQNVKSPRLILQMATNFDNNNGSQNFIQSSNSKSQALSKQDLRSDVTQADSKQIGSQNLANGDRAIADIQSVINLQKYQVLKYSREIKEEFRDFTTIFSKFFHHQLTEAAKKDIKRLYFNDQNVLLDYLIHYFRYVFDEENEVVDYKRFLQFKISQLIFEFAEDIFEKSVKLMLFGKATINQYKKLIQDQSSIILLGQMQEQFGGEKYNLLQNIVQETVSQFSNDSRNHQFNDYYPISPEDNLIHIIMQNQQIQDMRDEFIEKFSSLLVGYFYSQNQLERLQIYHDIYSLVVHFDYDAREMFLFKQWFWQTQSENKISYYLRMKLIKKCEDLRFAISIDNTNIKYMDLKQSLSQSISQKLEWEVSKDYHLSKEVFADRPQLKNVFLRGFVMNNVFNDYQQLDCEFYMREKVFILKKISFDKINQYLFTILNEMQLENHIIRDVIIRVEKMKERYNDHHPHLVQEFGGTGQIKSLLQKMKEATLNNNYFFQFYSQNLLGEQDVKESIQFHNNLNTDMNGVWLELIFSMIIDPSSCYSCQDILGASQVYQITNLILFQIDCALSVVLHKESAKPLVKELKSMISREIQFAFQ